jgi:hypothetical protein
MIKLINTIKKIIDGFIFIFFKKMKHKGKNNDDEICMVEAIPIITK